MTEPRFITHRIGQHITITHVEGLGSQVFEDGQVVDGCCMPTCFKCRSTNDVTFGPDPYSLEIAGDDTPVWECQDCRFTSTRDI